MKKSVLAFALVLNLTSINAMAMHAYTTAQCNGVLPNGKNLSLSSASGGQELAVLDQNGQANPDDQNIPKYPASIAGSNIYLVNADSPLALSLTVTSEKQLGSKKSWEDTCWSDTSRDFETQVQVTGVSPALAKEIGLTSGMKVKMSCWDNITAPEGKCDDQ